MPAMKKVHFYNLLLLLTFILNSSYSWATPTYYCENHNAEIHAEMTFDKKTIIVIDDATGRVEAVLERKKGLLNRKFANQSGDWEAKITLQKNIKFTRISGEDKNPDFNTFLCFE